jgi:ribose 5-phosphate isomerase B
MQIAIASDHAGYKVKEHIKQRLVELGYEVNDMGTYAEEAVDYPDMIHPLAHAVAQGIVTKAVIICGSGNGVSMVANKYAGVRAALCWIPELARMARLHNDANILALPGRYINNSQADAILAEFLNNDFEGGRHQRRVEKIDIGK